MESVKTLGQGYTFGQLNTESWITEGTAKVPDSFRFNQTLHNTEGPYDNYESNPGQNNIEFFQANVQYPLVIRKCLPFRFNKNYKEYYKMIQYLTKRKLNSNNNTTFNSLYGLKKTDFKAVDEQLTVEKDTLDDSDIENLIDDEDDEENDNVDHKTIILEDEMDPDRLAENTVLPEYEDDLCLTNTEVLPESMENVIDSYIVVGDRSFYLVGSHIIHRIFEYTDIVTFRPNVYPSIENKFSIWDDRILAITQDGYFVSIVMSRLDSNYIKDFTSHVPNKITQYWNLRMGKHWKIVTSSHHNFVAVVQQELNKELPFPSGLMVKLFYWVNAIEFKLVNSVILPLNGKIISCAFMPTKQPTLAICSGEDTNSKITLIQWNENTFKVQETISVKTTLNDSLSTLIPISATHLFISTNLTPQCIVALDDLYEKKFNPITTTIHSWHGKIISWFHSDDMLASLVKTATEYKKFDHCTLVANKSGQVFCVLSINNSEQIEIYLIENEITGMTSIAACSNQDSTLSHLFKILVARFDECTELTIDLSKMKEITRKEIFSGHFEFNDTTSLNNTVVNFNPICSVSPSKQTGLLPVDSRKELWTTTDDVVCQMQPIPFIFTRRSFQINQVAPDFKHYCNINFITGNSMFGSKLIWVTDDNTITKCYAIEAEFIQNYLGEKSSQLQYVQLDDLLPSSNEKTLFVQIYETFGIQVTKSEVLLKSFTDLFEVKSIFKAPDNHRISKAEFQDDKLIIWDRAHSRVWCINDLSLGMDAQCLEITKFNELLVNHSKVSFHILHINNSIDDTSVMIRNETGLYSTSFEDFISNNSENITPIKSIPNDAFVICSEHLCVFLYHNNAGNPMVRITNITGNIVVIWDRISAAFKPGENIQLKKLSDRSIACYSLTNFFIIFLNEVNDIMCEEVSLPYINRIVQLLDVEYDQTSEILFCLFNDGLRMVKLTHLSQFKSHHFLPDLKNEVKSHKQIKDTKKIFHYLKKLNRVLVAYPRMRIWYLIKLENGHILRLKNDLLKTQKYRLQQVIEIEDKSSDALLLLKFQNCIKYVSITVKHHKIRIKEMDQYMSNLLYPKNSIIYNPQRDSFIIIQTDRICKDSDSDVGKDIFRYNNTNYSDYEIKLNSYHPNHIQNMKSIYTEFRISEDKIKFTNKELPIDIDFASMVDYFVFDDNIIINTVNGMMIYSCCDLNKGIHAEDSDLGVEAVKINDNMVFVKRHDDGEYRIDGRSMYEIVFNGNIMEIAHDPEKYWKCHSTLRNEALRLIEDGSSTISQKLCQNSSIIDGFVGNEFKHSWSPQECLNASLKYYGGEGLPGMWPKFGSNPSEDIAEYIVALPQIFPDLNSKQKVLHPRSFCMNHISRVHFDPQHNILYIISENAVIYQFNNIPADFSTCNYMSLDSSRLMRKYIANGGTGEYATFQPTVAKQQSFTWVSF